VSHLVFISLNGLAEKQDLNKTFQLSPYPGKRWCSNSFIYTLTFCSSSQQQEEEEERREMANSAGEILALFLSLAHRIWFWEVDVLRNEIQRVRSVFSKTEKKLVCEGVLAVFGSLVPWLWGVVWEIPLEVRGVILCVQKSALVF